MVVGGSDGVVVGVTWVVVSVLVELRVVEWVAVVVT